MKVKTLMEVLLICVLIAFVSAKSVQPTVLGRNASAIVAKLDNVTESNIIMREDIVDAAAVQVVPDLVDSEEVVSNAISQSNEVLDAVVEDAVAVKPAAIAADKPSAIADNIATAVVSNEIDKPVNNDDPNPINKFCTCSEAQCKCCRDFLIPLIPVRGPGCATIRYLDSDKLGVTIKYGDFVLASRQIDSKRSTPICVPLPGGFNRFCGRVYGISREKENFKACLGLELRADDEVEASLRVSCFQFGPRGLATMEAEPLPALESTEDDDDDDDFLGLGGLGGDDDDDDDDDEDAPAPGVAGIVGQVLSGLGAGGGGGDDDDGFAGFSLLGSASDFIGGIFGSDSNQKKKPSESITINRRNDVKEKKKKIADLRKKSSISKMDEDVLEESDENTTESLEKSTENLKTKDDDTEDESTGGILDVVEAAIDVLSGDDGKNEKKEPTKDSETIDKDDADDDDYDEENDDDDDDDYDEDDKPNSNEVTDTKGEQKISKKKKVKSGYGLGFLGRFFNFFNYN